MNIKSTLRSCIICLTIVLSSNTFAAAPNTYYNNAEGKKERALKTALHDIIDGHRDKGYDGLYNIYKDSDNDNGKVWDMYSECTWYHGKKKCGNYSSVCDCYNREHTIPQSWFNEGYPMRSDAHHVIPTDGKINGLRSSYPHGENNAGKVPGQGLGSVGSNNTTGFSGTVYEPDDEYKGDIARMYFYFVTRYEDKMTSLSKTGSALAKNTYPCMNSWFMNTMLKWHRQDPVSQKERDRNDGIYKHQNNRNPFIDFPQLVEHIWGTQKSVAWYKNSTSTEEIVENKIFIAQIPVKENIIIDGNSTFEFYYEIFSIAGQRLQADESVIGENINVSNLNNGIYFMRIKANNHSSTLKFIVAK